MTFGKNVKRSKKVKRETVDKPPAFNAFGPVESDIYEATIKKAYIQESVTTHAQFFKLELDVGNNKTIRVSECFQSGDAKNNQVFYTDSDGVDHDLPGYAMLNELLVCAMGDDIFGDESDDPMDIFQLFEAGDVEVKPVKIYDYNKKKELPQKVPVILPLIGVKIKVGVIKVVENKTATDSAGKFMYKKGKPVLSAETKELNQVNYYFDIDGFTSNEFIAEDDEPSFIEQWRDAYQGRLIDRTTKVSGTIKGSGSKRSPMRHGDVFND